MLEQRHSSQDHFSPLIEYLVIFVIILVIFHTMIEEIATILVWDHSTVNRIVIAGFFFDLFFSVEFIARGITSSRDEGFKTYFFSERGWIDALSSIPLLLLVSGPSVFMILLGIESGNPAFEYLHILKTAKAIRVTRVLRLIRVVKLFGKIQNTESMMTNRHMGTISTIGVVALIVTLAIHHMLPIFRIGDHGDYIKGRLTELTVLMDSSGAGAINQTAMLYLLRNDPRNEDVIYVKNKRGDLLYESPEASALEMTVFPERNIPVGSGYSVTLSYRNADIDHAKVNLLILVSVLALIAAYVLFYTRIFAQQIADPIFIMDKGLRRWDYNLEVKIHEHFHDEEVFRLARAYNARWLPLKSRLRRGMKDRNYEKSVLKMDDLNFI